MALDAPPKFDGAVVIGAPMIVATDPARTNLVLICIDTLRDDPIGCHGAVPSSKPAMDALAAAGTRFSRFVAASSWTLPSHATLFSGQEPLVHGANRIGGRVGSERTPLLARELATAGWVTGAFTGGGFLDPAFGLATGFDHHSVRDPGRLPIGQKEASFDPMAPAISWLERHADEPFFIFVHSYVVHDYAPSDAYLARVPSAATAELSARDSIKVRLEFGAGDAARKPAIERLYREALLQADELIVARILRELEARKIDGRTIVGIVSDHGDQWLEHDGIFHGEELWRELVEVPCILRGAAIPVGAVRDEPVGHLDLAPTLLAQLGIERRGAMRGRDLFGESFEPEPVLLLVHGESGVVVEAVTAWPWRLIRRHVLEGADPECHLFRIDLDRLEQRNLAAAEPARLDALQRWLDAKLLECARASLGESPSGTVDSDLARRLKELGCGNR